MRYKITNIDWDADEDAVEGLPTEVEMDSDDGIDQMLDGGAADWLAGNYGCRVKACTVSAVLDGGLGTKCKRWGRKMFTVMIRRVEMYALPVNVFAESKEEAERKVEKLDWKNEYEDYWNELDPATETTYTAKASEHPECGEGPVR